MTAPLIVGVPSAAHREALLRETAGGGRVPTVQTLRHRDMIACLVRGCAKTHYAAAGDCALILSHPTDPEAGAMGLARLAWVANGLPGGMEGLVVPRSGYVVGAQMFASRCVHLGLLDRVERVEVVS